MNASAPQPAQFNIGRVFAVAVPFILIALGIVAYSYYGTGLGGNQTYSSDDLVPISFKLTFRGQPLKGAEVNVLGAPELPRSLAISNDEGVAQPDTDIGNGVLAPGVFKKELRVTVSARLPGSAVPGPEYTPEQYRTLESTPLVFDFTKYEPGEVIEISIEDDETAMTPEDIEAYMANIAAGQANAAAMSAARDRQNSGGSGDDSTENGSTDEGGSSDSNEGGNDEPATESNETEGGNEASGTTEGGTESNGSSDNSES